MFIPSLNGVPVDSNYGRHRVLYALSQTYIMHVSLVAMVFTCRILDSSISKHSAPDRLCDCSRNLESLEGFHPQTPKCDGAFHVWCLAASMIQLLLSTLHL